MAVGQEFLDMINGLNNYYGEVQNPQDPFLHWEQITDNYEIYPSELENTVDLLPKGDVVFNADGTIRSYDIATEVTSDMDLASMIDSNIQPTKTNLNIPSNTTVDSQTGKVVATTGVAGGASVGNFVRGSLVPAVAAVGTGITLGKAFDEILYHANPDFWDSIGWSTLNPETWSSVTQDDDSLNARVFNAIFGLDPVNNTSQAYIDQNALAYLALVLQQLGVFAEGSGKTIDDPSSIGLNIPEGLLPLPAYDGSQTVTLTRGEAEVTCVAIGDNVVYTPIRLNFNESTGSASPNVMYASENPFTVRYDNGQTANATRRILNNKTFYTLSWFVGYEANYESRWSGLTFKNTTAGGSDSLYASIGYVLLYGYDVEAIEGISTQTGATTPQLANDDTVADVLAKLQTEYPDLFNQAITQDVVQPDGSVITYTYVPIAMPDPNTTPTEGYSPTAQPVSGTATQEDPETDPETATQTQLAYIIGLLENTTQDLDDTGEGETPPVVIPSGTASALFSVYNPSQSEINSFGGWLWSSNFVDQLLKMFNDPMQAIISLHKVFCSPSVSGRDNITVGYLDSGVSANVVSGQYVDVNCGSVNLAEQYQNVFDYPPYTDVTIYLPFVGFVRLDTNDVMRGSINVVYHIDVLTGACLAEVKVTRDSFGGVIYQYSGDCSVHYPLSSGSYMGIVSALLGVAGTVVSGGTLAPMAIGMAAGAMRGHANVERSGSLSGNAGAMGIKKPYLVIQRPQINTPSEFEKFMGKPSNSLVTIGECTGYIKCKEVHVLNTPATESEIQELVSLLKEGVIL